MLKPSLLLVHTSIAFSIFLIHIHNSVKPLQVQVFVTIWPYAILGDLIHGVLGAWSIQADQ